MLIEYVETALQKAKYEMIDDTEPFYAEVPQLKGVWATGNTLEECRRNLAAVVEGWLMVRLRKGLTIPQLGRIKVKPASLMRFHG
jgi:predicted RNase H-like HicB family nuclease